MEELYYIYYTFATEFVCEKFPNIEVFFWHYKCSKIVEIYGKRNIIENEDLCLKGW